MVSWGKQVSRQSWRCADGAEPGTGLPEWLQFSWRLKMGIPYKNSPISMALGHKPGYLGGQWPSPIKWWAMMHDTLEFPTLLPVGYGLLFWSPNDIYALPLDSLWMIDGFLTDHQRNYAQLLLFYIVPGYVYICSCMYILFSDQPHISVPGPVSNEIVVVAFAGLTRFLPYGPVCAPRWSKISYRRCMSEFGVRWKSECSSYVVYICFISGLYVGYIYIYVVDWLHHVTHPRHLTCVKSLPKKQRQPKAGMTVGLVSHAEWLVKWLGNSFCSLFDRGIS